MLETAILYIAVLVVLFLLKSLILNDLTTDRARKMLQEGATLIDVRTEREYSSSHLERAVNIPLSDLEDKINVTAPDRGKVILLYCRSGIRSFSGKKVLQKMGYNHAYNLGSFGRARRILKKV